MTILSENKRQLYPTVFCYHGCVGRRADVLTFRQHIDDIKNHVRRMKSQGYEFVLPSQYKLWQTDPMYRAAHPNVTCIHLDDCLQSIELIVPWLILNGVPCGIPIITRRQGKYDPEDGFASWQVLKGWVATGLVEMMSHTHNLHHLTLREVSPGVVDVGPVLEGPCWIDDGDVVYRADGDDRWYWDFSHVDEITLGIPLWGTDPYDGVNKIVTTLTMATRATGSVEKLRLWMALSKPSGAGYDCQVRVRANGTIVFEGTISPKQYETRSQWVEREFYTINLDTPFNIVDGGQVILQFETLNTGPGCALLYGLVTADDVAYRAVTNCQGLYPAGSQGAPGKFWQYIDYPQYDRWPVIPCLILAFGTGRNATTLEYQSYVEADCEELNAQLDANINATWTSEQVYEAPYTIPAIWTGIKVYDYQVVGWNYPDKVEAVIPLSSNTGRVVDALMFQFHAVESFEDGAADPNMNGARPLTADQMAAIAEAQTRSYVAVFDLFIGDTQTGPWTHIGVAPIWRIAKLKTIPVTPFTMPAVSPKWLRIVPINGGVTADLPDRVCRWPIRFVTARTREPGAAYGGVDQIAYPFGSYLSPDGAAQIIRPTYKDISPDLRTVLNANGITRGYTIQAIRNTPDDEVREPPLRQTDMALGRWLVYGDQAPRVSMQNLAAISGYLFHDVQAQGVKVSAALRPDPLGNATIQRRVHTLDFVTFDAYSVNGLAPATPEFNRIQLNDGTNGYYDDKGWLKARGVPVLITINARDGEALSVDKGYNIMENPVEWADAMAELCLNEGWDGINLDLEGVSELLRDDVTSFFIVLSRRLHEEGLLFHAMLPARTNLPAYDAVFRTEWADHGELIKYVDHATFTTYRATSEFTGPGSHSPDDYWEAALQYIAAAVPLPYRPRVLLGASLHGHIWYFGDPERKDYHSNIQECLTYGKEITISGGDGGWGTADIKGWFGTPKGVSRAKIAAANMGLGGVHLDALDDGDIQEFFPTKRIIIAEADMPFIDTRFPETISFGSSGGPRFKTYVTEVESGDEYRHPAWSMPLYEFDASHGVRSQEEYEAIRNLFMVARGKYNSFRYKDFTDFHGERVVIGMGNGSTVNFQLVKAYAVGSMSLLRKITKPVAGTVRVWVGETEQLSGWTVNTSTGLVSFAVAPVGEVSATFDFDVQVRFDSDELPADITSWGEDGAWLSPGTIKLVEVRR